jgi:hypothetical protein
MHDDVRAALSALHDRYTEAVNSAVGEGREDLVEHLVSSYPDEALRLLVDAT